MVQLLARNFDLAQTLQIASIPVTVIILRLVILLEAAAAKFVEQHDAQVLCVRVAEVNDADNLFMHLLLLGITVLSRQIVSLCCTGLTLLFVVKSLAD